MMASAEATSRTPEPAARAALPGVERPRRRFPWTGLATAATLTVVLVASLVDLGFFESGRMARGLANLPVFLADFFPPDFSADVLGDLVGALVETVQMAFVGTLLGAALGLPFAVAAARTLAPPIVARPVRLVLAFVRTVPSLLWALVFVILFGLGPLPGVLGLAVYTMGYVGKLWYEAFEGLDPDVLDAVRATGAGRVAIVRHAAVPEAANALLSQLLYAFEYNVRASSILGFVGAGGIGFYLFRYFELFEYGKLTTAVLMLLVLVVAIDVVGRRIRRRFLHAPPEGSA